MTEFKAWWDSINWPSLSFRPMIDIVEGAKNKYKEIVDLIKGLVEEMENRVELPIQINILSICPGIISNVLDNVENLIGDKLSLIFNKEVEDNVKINLRIFYSIQKDLMIPFHVHTNDITMLIG